MVPLCCLLSIYEIRKRTTRGARLYHSMTSLPLHHQVSSSQLLTITPRYFINVVKVPTSTPNQVMSSRSPTDGNFPPHPFTIYFQPVPHGFVPSANVNCSFMFTFSKPSINCLCFSFPKEISASYATLHITKMFQSWQYLKSLLHPVHFFLGLLYNLLKLVEQNWSLNILQIYII